MNADSCAKRAYLPLLGAISARKRFFGVDCAPYLDLLIFVSGERR